MRPDVTSCMVPSPPHTTMTSASAGTRVCAMSEAWLARCVSYTTHSTDSFASAFRNALSAFFLAGAPSPPPPPYMLTMACTRLGLPITWGGLPKTARFFCLPPASSSHRPKSTTPDSAVVAYVRRRAPCRAAPARELVCRARLRQPCTDQPCCGAAGGEFCTSGYAERERPCRHPCVP